MSNIAALNTAVNWALSQDRTHEQICAPAFVNDAVAANVIDTATADGVVDNDERAALSSFAERAELSNASKSRLQSALSLPRESATTIATRARIEQAREFARQGAATGTNEGAMLGALGAFALLLSGGR